MMRHSWFHVIRHVFHRGLEVAAVGQEQVANMAITRPCCCCTTLLLLLLLLLHDDAAAAAAAACCCCCCC
jgi:hypothetical protein